MELFSDVRVAFRQLRNAWGYTLTALAILALGIGAGTAIFTIVNAVLLRPLPYVEAERIVSICETHASVDPYCVASPPNVQDWADAVTSLESIGFAREWSFVMRQDGRASGVRGGFATPGWFRALGVAPEVGRIFEPEDLTRGDRVALLAHQLWVDQFGADRGVIGRSVSINGEAHAVVGVLPATFVPADLGPVSVWTPPPWDPRDEERRAWRGFVVAARLAEHTSLEQVRAELDGVRAAMAVRHPETNEAWGVRVLPLHEVVTGSTRPVFVVFAGAVALLLLVACANLANLALIRAQGRRREMAVRTAIGGRRLALVRLLLTESVLLSLAGGVAGYALAALATRMIVQLAPAAIPRIGDVAVDASAFLFALGLAAATAAAFGLTPALVASRVDLSGALREGMGSGRSSKAKRSRRILVAAEVALTLMLLVGAGLLVRSFSALMRWDPGFDRANVLTLSAFAPPERYVDTGQVGALWSQLEREIASLPGVRSVSTASAGPVFGGIERYQFEVSSATTPGEPRTARWYDASPGYLATLGVPIVRGRPLSETDQPGGPDVAVVNETLARHWFPDSDAIGQRVRAVEGGLELEIVGVAADVAPFQAGQPVEPQIWWSNRQNPRWGTFIVLRGELDPVALSRSVRARIDRVDPEIQTGAPTTLAGLVDRQLVEPRFNLFLVAALASIALVLATAGVYGVVATIVTTRRREIGIRLALGEDRRGLTARFVREGVWVSFVGLAIGAVGALAISRFLQSLLFGVTSKDPATFGVTAAALMVITLTASLAPALRASRTDPAIILRDE